MNQNLQRCSWCLGDPLYIKYHDLEWGKPVYEDQKLFEFLILETFQAGLSWITILRKRENFREAFDNFDYLKVASFNTEKLELLMQNKGIIRNRLKIYAAMNNAQAFLEVIRQEKSFSNYIWQFVEGKPIQNQYRSMEEIPAYTPLAEKISKDLKQRGFKFVGPTVIYAHMQATGMVNDHVMSCFLNKEIQQS
ncbi:MAG: DNA-3-methyladenine glycosylase I [Flavobacteriales bacterium MED-G22]|nr:MAG: DNA-3-methyladenine glycosylase I [Flavobacteriales bacterium MED-G22]